MDVETPVTRAEFDLLCQFVECLSCQDFQVLGDRRAPWTPQTDDLMRRWVAYRTNPATLQTPPSPRPTP